jgi:hypothetical protein
MVNQPPAADAPKPMAAISVLMRGGARRINEICDEPDGITAATKAAAATETVAPAEHAAAYRHRPGPLRKGRPFLNRVSAF